MKNIHPAAYKFVFGALLLGAIYSVLLIGDTENDSHTHQEEGVIVLGHEDHMHVTYQPVFELEPSTIQSITAYFPHLEFAVSISNEKKRTAYLQSDCLSINEWTSELSDFESETALTEREYREFRNLYSKITPDFRIDNLPEGEDYGLSEPDGCIAIQTEGEKLILHFGRQSAQGFSRYLRLNIQEPVYVVSRYFYTELENLAENN